MNAWYSISVSHYAAISLPSFVPTRIMGTPGA